MENSIKPLLRFHTAIQNDPRIGATHIAVYLVLYFKWLAVNGDFVYAFASEVMPEAKISSRMTYRKVIFDLSQHGYIDYEPSFDKNKASKISLKI